MVLRAIFAHALKRCWVAENAALGVEKHPVRYSGDYDLYSREETDALVRHAGSEQFAAIFATAAMTGLRRGELVALRWHDVDFTGQAIRVRGNYSLGEVVTPKSGKVRSFRSFRRSLGTWLGWGSGNGSSPMTIRCSSTPSAATSTPRR